MWMINIVVITIAYDRRSNMKNEVKQKESGRRLFLATAGAALCLASPARASDKLDAGGLTFLDFATPDNGASFARGDPMIAGGPNPVPSKILGIENAKGFARDPASSRSGSTLAMPLGWQATEDWERGVGYSSDKRYRLIVWRVDFDYEGVKDAEHYASTKAARSRRGGPGSRRRRASSATGPFWSCSRMSPKAQGDAEPRVVFDLVIPQPGNPKLGVLLTLGVPASDAGRGIKLAGSVKGKYENRLVIACIYTIYINICHNIYYTIIGDVARAT